MYGNNYSMFLINPFIYGAPISFSNLKSLSFDGVDEWVSVPNDASLNITDELSVFLWVKLPSYNALNAYLNKGTYQYGIYSTPNGEKFEVILGDGTTGYDKLYSVLNDSIPLNTWTFIGFTFSGGTVKLYQNGVEVAVSKKRDNVLTTLGTSTMVLEIGKIGAVSNMLGQQDELSIWDTAVLSDADILALYNSGCPTDLSVLSTSANLVSWWRVDDSTYPTLTDTIGSNDGTMTNQESGDITTDTPC